MRYQKNAKQGINSGISGGCLEFLRHGYKTSAHGRAPRQKALRCIEPSYHEKGMKENAKFLRRQTEQNIFAAHTRRIKAQFLIGRKRRGGMAAVD